MAQLKGKVRNFPKFFRITRSQEGNWRVEELVMARTDDAEASEDRHVPGLS